MTLERTDGGPVFDGLWFEDEATGHKYSHLMCDKIHSGAWNCRNVYKNLVPYGHPDYVLCTSSYDVTYCLMPINLVKWSD